MAKAVGFDKILAPVVLYKSASKGPIPVASMATPHIANAMRGRLIATFAEMLKGKDVKEMRDLISTLDFYDFIFASEDVSNLNDEFNKRQ